MNGLEARLRKRSSSAGSSVDGAGDLCGAGKMGVNWNRGYIVVRTSTDLTGEPAMSCTAAGLISGVNRLDACRM